MRDRILFGSAAAVAFLFGTVALWYGFAMSFLVPGTPGAAYFQKDRVLLGNLPLAASPAVLCAASWMATRALQKPSIRLRTATLYSVASAAALLIVFLRIGALVHLR
jgi:hypothetical protein